MNEPDDRWLLLRERGGDVSHVPAHARARYEQLAGLIQALPGEAPRPGWKARTLAAIDESPSNDRTAMGPHKRAWPVWLNRVGLVMAASCAAVIGWCSLATEEYRRVARGAGDRVVVASGQIVERPTLADDALVTTTILHGKPVRGEVSDRGNHVDGRITSAEPAVRAEYAHVGDTLILNVKADPALELRVYGDAGEPLGRCAEMLDCSLDMVGNVAWFRLEVPLRAPGRVRAMMFAGNSIPARFENLNADLESAHEAKVETSPVALVLVN